MVNTTRSLALFLALALLGLIWLVLATRTARAADPVIVRVTTTGTTMWPCGQTNWSNPCALQTALSNTVSGSELWVAAGTYTPTMGITRTATFQLRDAVALYGGFAGIETLRTQRNFTANVTILSGEIGMPGNGDNVYHVVTGSGVTNTAVFDGFTVRDGNANGTELPNKRGGGMYNTNGNPTVANVIFSNNWAVYGGGMYSEGGSPTVTNVTYSFNSAGEGGGMYNASSSPTVTNATFYLNFADSGGGMYNYLAAPTVAIATFDSNIATFGGGVYNEGSNPTLTNVTFFDNKASGNGGGMINDNHSSPTVTNVTFGGNWGKFSGGGIANSSSSPTLRNTILWGDTSTYGSEIDNYSSTTYVYDSVVQGGYAGGANIITADPRLGGLGNWGGPTQTIPLLPGSSAINAGNNATCAPTDQRGKPRVGTCDIGAFESQGFTLTKTSGDDLSTPANRAFPSPLSVDVGSASYEPVDGGVVTFTAPSAGASTTPVTNTATIASGAVTQTLVPNGILGSYAVTAHTAGAIEPVTFTLTNTNSLYLFPLVER